jgi:hypothetical protein
MERPNQLAGRTFVAERRTQPAVWNLSDLHATGLRALADGLGRGAVELSHLPRTK